MRVAAVQLNSTDEKDRNLEVAERLVRDAAAAGAELIGLPEKWPVLGGTDALRGGAEPLDGPTLSTVGNWARELGVHILAGSISELDPAREKLLNTSTLIDRDGEIVAAYRKIHMFDVDVGGVTYRESAHEDPGDEVVLADAGGVAVGLTVCYDLRFPELYREHARRGARFLCVPSAFAPATGRDHWEVLLRARAIENQAFVIAPAQWGDHAPNRSSYGRSLVVDPWGVVLATVGDREGVATADCDLAAQDQLREALPALTHRRL
jgi:predicted amidohydrolase